MVNGDGDGDGGGDGGLPSSESKIQSEKVIIKLSKRKAVARVMNNKKKLKNMKLQNIGVPSGFKIYINESLLQTRGSIQSFWVTNVSITMK